MGSFSKSLSRELGKNTGKFLSNIVFGDKHSTPYRFISQQRQEQRLRARTYIENVRTERLLMREQIKQQREFDREQKERDKINRIENNTNIVNEFESFLNIIRRVHLDSKYNINWNEILNAVPPKEIAPAKDLENQIIAASKMYVAEERDLLLKALNEKSKYNIKNYFTKRVISFLGHPFVFIIITIAIIVSSFYGLNFYMGIGLIAFLFILMYKHVGVYGYESALKQLNEFDKTSENRLKLKIEEERVNFQNKYEENAKQIEEVNFRKEIALDMLNEDKDTMLMMLKELKPFDDLNVFDVKVEYKFNDDNFYLKMHATELIVPKEKYVLLRNGSEIKSVTMTNSEIYDIYQDFVCSCVLRLGLEIFGIMPLKNFVLDVYSNFMDKSTGREEQAVILSIELIKAKLYSLNLEYIDPSESMSNFKHNMNFSPRHGFSPVNSII